MTPKQFQTAILKWFDKNGRKSLPWQTPSSPYRVWLSEIMLQQTQVKTVIPYFQKFVQRFPTLKSLAAANIDEVLSLWSGLGYYARARNLHRTAQMLQTHHHGKFPTDLITLQSLPGIGRSTAGAILAFTQHQRTPILDGNVKRVLARFHAIAEWPGKPEINKQLWLIADNYTPKNRVADYTQAMMDLGALVCTRSKPNCLTCPLQHHCTAYASNNPAAYPGKKPSKQLPTRSIQMLILLNQKQEIFLEKRPPVGIWGGLWSLPECANEQDIQQFCKQQHHYEITALQIQPSLRHTFSHFHLEITPVVAKIKKSPTAVMEQTNTVWYKITDLETTALAAPVKKLLLNIDWNALCE
jgi:A/G-specific adenine glycosylase